MTTLTEGPIISQEHVTPLILDGTDLSADDARESFLIIAPLKLSLGPDLLEATVPCRNCGLGE